MKERGIGRLRSSRGVAGWLDALFGVDLRSLAALRISVGGLLAADLMHRWTEVSAFYSDAGVLPRSEAPGRFANFPLPHFLSGSMGYLSVLVGVQVLFALALALGYRTKWVTPISWFLLISLEARNPYVLQGSDGLFRVLLLWGMFLPWGRVWSLDRRRKLISGSLDAVPARFLSMASAGVLLQVCVVYLFSAALKHHGVWFDDGSAVFQALSVDCWTTDFGRGLLEHRDLLAFLSRATYLLEWIGPILAFCPIGTSYCRLLVIASFWCFHLLGLAPTMHLGPFPYLSAASWLLFLPTCFWERVEGPWRRSVIPRLGILREMLPPSLRPVSVDGGIPLSPRTSGAGWLHQGIAGLLVVNLLVWNTFELEAGGARRRLPWWWSKVAFTLRLDQRWGMFAPAPRTADGWFVIIGTTANGVDYDLIRGGTAILWERPARVSDWIASYRWRCYLLNVHKQARGVRKEQFARYLCRTWNASHDLDEQIIKIRIYYMLERTLPDWTVAPPKRQLFYVHACRSALTIPAGVPGEPEPASRPVSNDF